MCALWPAGFGGGIDWIAASTAVGAAIALFRFRRTVIEVIGVCGALGLAASTVGI